MNLFTYVANNLVNVVDLLGLYWEYGQSTGQLYYVDNRTGINFYVATGFSGSGEGKNNPFMEQIPFVGPIPQGTYTIGPQMMHWSSLGTKIPASMSLIPKPGTETFNRYGLLIHSGSRSTGCIVFEQHIVDIIANSGDTELRVVPVVIPWLPR
jgi:hypothetical protein